MAGEIQLIYQLVNELHNNINTPFLVGVVGSS